MKLVIQRVKKASVYIDNKIYNQINHGFLIYVGFSNEDIDIDLNKYVRKIINLRVFEDEFGKMNENILKIDGEILLISQFTLYADTKKGNRPSFTKSLNPVDANKLYDNFTKLLNDKITTKPGVFGANMQIKSINDGPVTIILKDL